MRIDGKPVVFFAHRGYVVGEVCCCAVEGSQDCGMHMACNPLPASPRYAGIRPPNSWKSNSLKDTFQQRTVLPSTTWFCLSFFFKCKLRKLQLGVRRGGISKFPRNEYGNKNHKKDKTFATCLPVLEFGFPLFGHKNLRLIRP